MGKLPDYMTYRRTKLKEKKNMKINYTLEITKNLPRQDFSKTRSKLQEAYVPDPIEKQL